MAESSASAVASSSKHTTNGANGHAPLNPALKQAIESIDVAERRSDHVVRIGTRASALALIQANLVREGLEKENPGVTFKIAPMSTAGDRNKTEPLYLMGSKALWTKDLEVALLDNVVDCIVHSLKDVPTTLPDGCEIAAVMEREDPRDALVVKKGRPWKSLDEMPEGSCIGSSSVRRVAQMRRRFPHLIFKDVRGNIDTRVNKLDAEDGPYDALILASAGLIRTGQSARITGFLQSPVMLHAVGQGAIGIETRSSDSRMKAMVGKLNHLETDWRTNCERTLLHVLEGGCSVPVGVETQFLPPARGAETDEASHLGERPLALRAIIASLDGKRVVAHDITRQIYSRAEAERMGTEVAQVLIQRGGKAILEELGRIVEQKNVKGVNDQVAQTEKEHMDVDQAHSQNQLP